MKKTAFASLMLVGLMAVPAFAADRSSTETPLISPAPDTSKQLTIQVNGKDTKANSYVMVPLRAVAGELGFTVTWKDGAAIVDNKTIHTTVTPGEDLYVISTSIDGAVGTSAPFSLGLPPYVSNGTTYVPLSLFEALLPEYNDLIAFKDGTIVITTKTITDNSTQANTENNAQIPNPFTDCATMAEAQKLTGFTLTGPETLSGYTDRAISVLANDTIQLMYTQGENSLTIRKAAGSGDISGDYNEYTKTQTVTVKNLSVTMKGNDGKISLATWAKDGYTFSVTTDQPMTLKAMSDLVASVG